MAIEQIFESYGNQLIAASRESGGSGSGGHTIENQAGTDMDQRSNMQFVDAQLSDDSTNDRTKIEIIKRVTKAQLDALGENTDGIYETIDEDDEPWSDVSDDYVEVTGDGEKTYGTLLNELFTKLDLSKVNIYSHLQIDTKIYIVQTIYSTIIDFTANVTTTSSPYLYNTRIRLQDNSSQFRDFSPSGYTNRATETSSDGEIIRLYYGTKSSTIQLNTDAQHCIMSDGETSVEESIDNFTNLSNVRKAFLSISGTVSSAADVAQEIIDSIDTSDGKNVIFEGIHQYAGIRMVYGYIYANKSYGAIFIATIGSYRYVGLNNGVLTVTNIV